MFIQSIFVSAPSPTNFNSFMSEFWTDPALASLKPPKVPQKKSRRKPDQCVVKSKDQDAQQLLQQQLQQGKKCRKFYSMEFKNFWCRGCVNKKSCSRIKWILLINFIYFISSLVFYTIFIYILQTYLFIYSILIKHIDKIGKSFES